MSTPLWEFADGLNVVPMEPDQVLRSKVAEWWSRSIRRGCRHHMGAVLFVVYPDLRLVCGRCALDALKVTQQCIYCDGSDVDETGENVVTENAHGLVVMFARAHAACSTEASR